MVIKPLSELKLNERGRIVKVGGRGRIRRRLLDMGIVAGAMVKVKGVAPLGDPIEIGVRDYNLALRKEEAVNIQVEVSPLKGDVMPLSKALPGETVEVADVRAGWGLQRRLADMGLSPGERVRLVKSQRGPVDLDVRGARLSLGHGVAHRIMVIAGGTEDNASAKKITIALAGNPNSGKTTVFNNLTGARQHVGNWPGVTVEKKEGRCDFKDYKIKVIDLPGVYSLTAYSIDEVVARDFIVDEKPDVVVDVVDASNLERNLYLTVQLLEMEANLVAALNMMDVAASRGYEIDVEGLSRLLGAPVIPMVAARNRGTRELLQAVVDVAGGSREAGGIQIKYGHDLEEEITKLEKVVSNNSLAQSYSPRWLAVKLLEEDKEIINKVKRA